MAFVWLRCASWIPMCPGMKICLWHKGTQFISLVIVCGEVLPSLPAETLPCLHVESCLVHEGS